MKDHSINRASSDALTAFSVIIPVYNEEGAIADTIDEIHATLSPTGSTVTIRTISSGSSPRRCASFLMSSSFTTPPSPPEKLPMLQLFAPRAARIKQSGTVRA